jgi:imidazole glycerol phosphate synthase glutamine amidotransferase subunit
MAFNEKTLIRNLEGLRLCSRCIYDEQVPGIVFDADGVCNYCRMTDRLMDEYGTGAKKGQQLFDGIVAQIKQAGAGRKYDCVVGVSGGTDSSYMLYLAVKMGLRPLAVHYDNTWNSAIATTNIRKVTSALNVDLYTHVVDNRESDDIFRAFLLAGVPEIDAATDIALAETLYRAAARYGINYQLEGHSFVAEGISPLGTFYADGKYISAIHKKFGNIPMKTFPNMPLWRFLYWVVIRRIRKIRPLWYIEYSKDHAREFLAKEYGWEYYGGHHLENRMTAFMHSYYLPRKFGNDQRNNSLSAAVRDNRITRDEALRIYSEPSYMEPELLGYFKKRMCLSDAEFEHIMTNTRKCYRDYPTYKQTFERMRPLFYILAKANLVPMSFYFKILFEERNLMITIVNYGLGNLGSIHNMLKRIGVDSVVSAAEEEIAAAGKLILPGVGHFDRAMTLIEESGLRRVLDHKALTEKVPVLGICLGMQLLTEGSEEGVMPGLGWIPGRTVRFRFDERPELKIPHMGWNYVEPVRHGPFTDGIDDAFRFYFVHSYHVVVDSAEDAVLTTEYGIRFNSGISRGNVFGVQFHPEKSHKFGMRLLKNFAELA